MPAQLPLSERSWKTLYVELRSAVWADSAPSSVSPVELAETRLKALRRECGSQKISSSRFRVNVYARFRPHEQPSAGAPPKAGNIDRNATKSEEDGGSKENCENGNSNAGSPPLEQDEQFDRQGRECVLPLHQRLRMIRMSGARTQREALRTMAAEGDWFGRKWAGESRP